MGIAKFAKSQIKRVLKANTPNLYAQGSRSWRRMRPGKFAEYRWAIGLYGGDDLNRLQPLQGTVNPILTRERVSDVEAEFVADPFMVWAGENWHLFFEIENLGRGKGEIGLATSANLSDWRYQGRVLSEPHHVSYPYVFAHDGRWYMVPETAEGGGVFLYEAMNFPRGWIVRKQLLKGDALVDPSLFHYRERWWMFVETSGNDRCDMLSLFHAEELAGPWIEHPRSPVVRDDPVSARPAGRVVIADRNPIRFCQDCSGSYGRSVTAFEVTDLNERSYSERCLGVVLAPGAGSPFQYGIHHIDAMKKGESWIACVDGR
jgi:hypothetical protein